MICEYCGMYCKAKKNLERHQATSKSCLLRRGVFQVEQTHICECKKVFTRKDNFQKHQRICKFLVANITANSHDTNVGTLNVNITVGTGALEPVIESIPKMETKENKQKSKYKKQHIKQSLREKLWEQEIGDKLWGNCFVCNMRLSFAEFACGHIQAERMGGKLELENLKVVCKSCNSKMGTMNMLEFKELRYPTSV